MKFIWYTVLIRALPEAIGMNLLILAFVKEKTNMKNLMLSSSICGLVAFILRMLPLRFGIHSLLVLIIQAFVMNIVYKIKMQKLFKGTIVCLVALAGFEMITLLAMEYIFKIDPQAVYSNGLSTIISGIPSILMLYALAYIIWKINSAKESRRLNKDVGA
ncbi:hypothetical protein OXPF_16190 [Oxobacter pfennigii]|uniref:Uncharacterized protein n=1 Tax=Oxobacter pfennigii TaxID=36849 RepID=A0A0N8NTD6_9CLOT|nr:hypothetical protein [Oxobacter pfennigii]KPU44536.1 hypothetical protein OXPF_16190 [Oxobacter pfennigii]